MSTLLRLNQAIDRIEQSVTCQRSFTRGDLQMLEDLALETDGTPLHRPTEKLALSLRKARVAERRREWLAALRWRRVTDRLDRLRGAVAIQTLGVAEHEAGFGGRAA